MREFFDRIWDEIKTREAYKQSFFKVNEADIQREVNDLKESLRKRRENPVLDPCGDKAELAQYYELVKKGCGMVSGNFSKSWVQCRISLFCATDVLKECSREGKWTPDEIVERDAVDTPSDLAVSKKT